MHPRAQTVNFNEIYRASLSLWAGRPGRDLYPPHNCISPAQWPRISQKILAGIHNSLDISDSGRAIQWHSHWWPDSKSHGSVCSSSSLSTYGSNSISRQRRRRSSHRLMQYLQQIFMQRGVSIISHARLVHSSCLRAFYNQQGKYAQGRVAASISFLDVCAAWPVAWSNQGSRKTILTARDAHVLDTRLSELPFRAKRRCSGKVQGDLHTFSCHHWWQRLVRAATASQARPVEFSKFGAVQVFDSIAVTHNVTFVLIYSEQNTPYFSRLYLTGELESGTSLLKIARHHPKAETEAMRYGQRFAHWGSRSSNKGLWAVLPQSE